MHLLKCILLYLFLCWLLQRNKLIGPGTEPASWWLLPMVVLLLEKAVARIQQLFDPDCTVTHNEFIVDRIGNKRQFDVVIRGKFGGWDRLGVIECKDWAQRVGPEQVEAFVTKAQHVNAGLVLMVSKKGFTAQATTLCKHHGVGTLSLLPDDPQDAGFSVGILWFAKVYQWDKFQHSSTFVGRTHDHFRPESVLLDGRPAFYWFHKQLVTTYGDRMVEETLAVDVRFNEPLQLSIDGEPYTATGLSLAATRVCKKKKKWLRVSGDAFHDWETGQARIPPGGTVALTGFDQNYLAWPDCEANEEFLKPTGFLLGCFGVTIEHFDPSMDVIDLTQYGTVSLKISVGPA